MSHGGLGGHGHHGGHHVHAGHGHHGVSPAQTAGMGHGGIIAQICQALGLKLHRGTQGVHGDSGDQGGHPDQLSSWSQALQGKKEQAPLVVRMTRSFLPLFVMLGGGFLWLGLVYFVHHPDAQRDHTAILSVNRAIQTAGSDRVVSSGQYTPSSASLSGSLPAAARGLSPAALNRSGESVPAASTYPAAVASFGPAPSDAGFGTLIKAPSSSSEATNLEASAALWSGGQRSFSAAAVSCARPVRHRVFVDR